ncbi:hypothetical protein CAPTEDRAFT_205141 [Capitella teleta]|uniref:UFSP1/2/DUB catalytic domain-containing protein n=1 Tax=Capitella teleta TaxID=283909 RepID=R7TT59_CAPTE|nr:hypothetical protein CAPTEDRAFT_205141 [Capitella teleta]|eukprot:ELT96809.1 hypothetical protein CAPTEDRAFT_205141 [Capitella teleta]
MEQLKNIHEGLALPEGVSSQNAFTVRGTYCYCYYNMDATDDRGWGCGYRTLQTLCSWILCLKNIPDPIPSLCQIQETLVRIGDKPQSIIGSRDWIGSIEVAMVIDTLYDVPCKILHIDKGSNIHEHKEELKRHFAEKGSPIMMGGSTDSASKGILGVCYDANNRHYLLVLDPHYHGSMPTHSKLCSCDMLLWKPLASFEQNSFYNLCLPQLSHV